MAVREEPPAGAIAGNRRGEGRQRVVCAGHALGTGPVPRDSDKGQGGGPFRGEDAELEEDEPGDEAEEEDDKGLAGRCAAPDPRPDGRETMGGDGAELLEDDGVNARASRETFPPQHRDGEVLLHWEVLREFEVGGSSWRGARAWGGWDLGRARAPSNEMANGLHRGGDGARRQTKKGGRNRSVLEVLGPLETPHW